MPEAGVDGQDDTAEDGVLLFAAALLPLRDMIAGLLAQVWVTGTVERRFGGPRAGKASSDSVFRFGGAGFVDWSPVSKAFCFPFATSDMGELAPVAALGSVASGRAEDEGGGWRRSYSSAASSTCG